jgi:hypothetical protein
MTKENEEYQRWSNDVAELIADAMIDANLITKGQFEESVNVIGLEIFVSLISGDYPPPLKPQLLSNEAE